MANKESEYDMRASSVRRLALIIWSAGFDQFQPHLADIQGDLRLHKTWNQFLRMKTVLVVHLNKHVLQFTKPARSWITFFLNWIVYLPCRTSNGPPPQLPDAAGVCPDSGLFPCAAGQVVTPVPAGTLACHHHWNGYTIQSNKLSTADSMQKIDVKINILVCNHVSEPECQCIPPWSWNI